MLELLQFLASIPDLIRLYKILAQKIKEQNTERKVKDDVKTIHEAFANSDATKLNALFNSK